VGHHTALSQLGNNVATIADQADGDVLLLTYRVLQDAQRLVERVDHEVAVAGAQALLDALRIDFDAEIAGAGHGRRQWLRAAHAAHTAGDDQLACKIAAEMLLARGGKSLVRPLDDSLRADVNPRASSHLAVHCEAELFQLVELLPVRPVTDEIGVADEHTRCVIVGAEDADWFARLHQQSLVVVQRLQRVDDGVIALPVARGAAGAAVYHQVLRALGDVGIEVVHQHAHGGFLPPSFAGELVAARRLHGNIGSAGRFCDDWHDNTMVVRGVGECKRQLRAPVVRGHRSGYTVAYWQLHTNN